MHGRAKMDCSRGRPGASSAVYTINLSMAYGQAVMLLSLVSRAKEECCQIQSVRYNL
jgi:hypothetical protein